MMLNAFLASSDGLEIDSGGLLCINTLYHWKYLLFCHEPQGYISNFSAGRKVSPVSVQFLVLDMFGCCIAAIILYEFSYCRWIILKQLFALMFLWHLADSTPGIGVKRGKCGFALLAQTRFAKPCDYSHCRAWKRNELSLPLRGKMILPTWHHKWKTQETRQCFWI